MSLAVAWAATRARNFSWAAPAPREHRQPWAIPPALALAYPGLLGAMIALNENRRAGMLLCGLGLLFSTLGFLLFDSALLSIGNILFLASFPLLVGMSQAIYLFNPMARPERWRGIVAFWLGVILVRARWPAGGLETLGSSTPAAPAHRHPGHYTRPSLH